MKRAGILKEFRPVVLKAARGLWAAGEGEVWSNRHAGEGSGAMSARGGLVLRSTVLHALVVMPSTV